MNKRKLLSMKKKETSNIPFSLEKMIKGMPEHAYVFSNEGRLLAWNINLETISEYSEDELSNKFLAEFVCKDDTNRIAGKFMNLIAKGYDKEQIIEFCLQTKFGKKIPCLVIRSVLVVNGVKYVVGIFLNLSKIKDGEEEFETSVTELTHLKNQLQDHFCGIERLSQSEIQLKERLHFNTDAFNSRLINNMPGIFYAFEKEGEKFFLKKWNKNFTNDLGYSDEELLNIEVRQLFTKKEFEKVIVGITEVFVRGRAQVEYNILHKSGKQIPYSFEAFPFEDKGRKYFIGIGLDISERYALEEKQKREEIEKIKAEEILDANKRELITTALEVSKTSGLIKYTLKQIDELLEKNSDSKISKDLKNIKNNLKYRSIEQDNWEVFKLRFREIHKDFFSDLKTKHPELTKSELKFCAYLRIHLSSSQIAAVLNVSKEGIKKTRYRIRKKINLSTKDLLEDYISTF